MNLTLGDWLRVLGLAAFAWFLFFAIVAAMFVLGTAMSS